MKLNSIYRVFCKGIVRQLLPKVQEDARKLGLDDKVVVLDANRQETRVDCNIRNGEVIPVVPGFMPQVINYGLPAVEGTAAVAIDIHKEGKLEIKVFKPQHSFLFFRNGMVSNLWNHLFEMFYLGAEKKDEENGEKRWHTVYKPIFQCPVPSYIMSDSQMREYLRDKLKGKVLDGHLKLLDELTLNPVIEKKAAFHKDKMPNNGVDISGKSEDGLPGVVRAQSEPGDELGEIPDNKSNRKDEKSGEGRKSDKPRGHKPKPEGKKPKPEGKKPTKAELLDEAAE